MLASIADDIRRMEYSKRFSPTPWFEAVGDQIVVHDTAGRPPLSEQELASRRFQNALGHSALLDAIFASTVKVWWYKDERYERAAAEGSGAIVAPLLVERLARRCRRSDTRVLLVRLGRERDDHAEKLLAQAAANGVLTLDLVAAFHERAAREPGLEERFFRGHMTASGNQWIAEQIADRLRSVR